VSVRRRRTASLVARRVSGALPAMARARVSARPSALHGRQNFADQADGFRFLGFHQARREDDLRHRAGPINALSRAMLAIDRQLPRVRADGEAKAQIGRAMRMSQLAAMPAARRSGARQRGDHRDRAIFDGVQHRSSFVS